jgi:hypothetical protein
MEQDKQLKQILSDSVQGTSVGFTNAVMKRVNDLSQTRPHYQPLVHPKWQRLFLYAFGTLIMAILFLCLTIAVTDVQVVTWIQNLNLPDFKYNTVFIFLGLFWLMFSVNALFEKKVLPRRQSFGYQVH